MLKIQKYLFKDLWVTWFFATFGFFCLSVLLNALTFIDNLIVDHWSFWLVIKLVALGMPAAVHTVLPTTLFLALLVVYWRKIKDAEFAVMRASGLSFFTLALPAILLTAIVTMFAISLNWFVNIESAKQFRLQKQAMASEAGSSLLPTGEFVRSLGGIVFYANKKGLDGKYLGVMIEDNRTEGKRTVILAQKADIVSVAQGFEVTLHQAVRFNKTQDKDFVDSVSFDLYRFETILPNKQSDAYFVKARELYFTDLLALSAQSQPPEDWPNFAKNKFEKLQKEYRAEFYNRLMHPLRYMGILALALLVLLGQSIARSTSSRRLIVAAVLFACAELWVIMLQAVSANLTQPAILAFIANAMLLLGSLSYYFIQTLLIKALPASFSNQALRLRVASEGQGKS